MDPIVIMFVGCTGSGKSALCNKMMAVRGGPSNHFRESADTHSQHTRPVCHEHEGVIIIDTMGLLDSRTGGQDSANIESIVAEARQCGAVNAFVQAMNEEVPRFDEATQAAWKLLVDSFGPAMLDRTGVAFTRACGRVPPEEARHRAADIAAAIARRTGLPVSHLPCWQVDCHPEQLEGQMLPEVIEQVRDASRTALQDILRWAQALPAMDTTTAVVGEYEEQRRRREAEAAAAAAAAEAEANRAREEEAERARAAAAAEAERQRQAAAEAERQRLAAVEAANARARELAIAQIQREMFSGPSFGFQIRFEF
eukprot:EG_transcript_15069